MNLFRCCSQAKLLKRGVYNAAFKGLPSRYGLIRDIGSTTRPFSTSTGIDVEKQLQEMLANSGYNSESGIDNDVKRSVERILNPQQDRCMLVEAPEKVRNQIATFQNNFGNKHYVRIFELSLQLALLQSKSNTLGPSLHGAIKAYSLGYSPDVSRLVADWNDSDQKIESDGTKYCVYAHTWIDLLVGEIKSIFDSQIVSERSKKATSLLKNVSKLYKHEQSPTTIALSYFGMTTSPTVKERETTWTYESNVLMYALWKKNEDMEPRTVVVFHIPKKYHKDEYTNQIISVVEFLLIELFNTYGGFGFNQEPGGRFNSGRSDFVTYDECVKLVRDLGITSKSKFDEWCNKNSESRIELGIPCNPYREYKDQGWVSWYVFFGTPPSVTEDTKLPYDQCAEYIQSLRLSSRREFHEWYSDNPEMRRKTGIPFNPHQAYKDIGWISWNHLLGTQPPVTEDTKLPYDECAKYIQGLHFKSVKEFRKWCNKNPLTRRQKGIPSNPAEGYKDQGWKDWPAFLLGDKLLDIIH